MRCVRSVVLSWKSRESESAMMLCLPGICSGYIVASDKNKIFAK